MNWLTNLVSLHTLSSQTQKEKDIVSLSVNYFPHRQCNYACQSCFHTSLNLKILPLDDAKRGLRMLADAGMKKLNISGGEPFLKPTFIGEVFKFCKEELKLESCSVVNNGSKVTEKWLDTYGHYLDVMAISCDSFDAETNVRIGWKDQVKKGDHVSRVFEVAEWCRQRGIKLKINSVINAYNWEEDMNEQIQQLSPERWKVFQVLLLDGENTRDKSQSRSDWRDSVISDEQFRAFLERHKGQESLVPEDNEAIEDSYLNLDEKMRQVPPVIQTGRSADSARFLNSETGAKVPDRSLLEVGVQGGLKDAGWNEKAFRERGECMTGAAARIRIWSGSKQSYTSASSSAKPT